ncbi:MAG: hypothetical protein Kow001_02080 [Acidobacteriota bacterium]
MTVSWNFEGGFSKLLETASLQVTLRKPPLGFSLEASPSSLFRADRRPVRLELDLARRWSLRAGPRWTVRPQGALEVLILPPGSAFLGNFRVGRQEIGIQWRVAASVEGGGKLADSPLVELKSRTRPAFTWVQVFDRPASVGTLLRTAWQGFLDPLDPGEVAALTPDRVVQFSWSGALTLDFSAPWSAGSVWRHGLNPPGVGIEVQAGAGAGLLAAVSVSRTGSYTLRWSRRPGRLKGTLTRERSQGVEGAFRIGVDLAGAVDLSARTPWLRPIVRQVETNLREALSRRLSIALAVSSARRHTDRTVLRLTERPGASPQELESACAALLGGQVPPPDTAVEIDSVFETIRRTETSIGIHLWDWTVGRTRSREERIQVHISPDGELVVERGVELAEVRQRWEELQFFRLISGSAPGENGVRWSFGLEGRLRRDRLVQTLRAALHAGAISHFSEPAGRGPWEGRLLWVTRFSPQALAAVFSSATDDRFCALVRALEVVEPRAYGPGSYRRDWIESPPLRELVERDPVAAPLRHRYPVPGRSDFQRRQVVDDYRRVRSFLLLLERSERDADQWELLRRGFRLPIFLFCHFVCPPALRESAVLLEAGAETTIWGRTDLLEG